MLRQRICAAQAWAAAREAWVPWGLSHDGDSLPAVSEPKEPVLSDSFTYISAHTADRAAALLLNAAGPRDWSALIAARPGIVRTVVEGSQPIPRDFAEAALRRGEGDLLGQLRRGADRVMGVPDLLDRLAESGHPDLYYQSSREFQAALLRSAHLSPAGWNRLDLTRWTSWMKAEDELAGRRVFVVSQMPALLRSALERVGHLLSEREQALALRNLYVSAGPGAAEAWFGELGELGERAAADVAAGGDLSALVAWADGGEATIRELRAAGRKDREWLLAQRPVLDWEALWEANRVEPFDAGAVGPLVAREDCPGEFVTELYATQPAAVAEHARLVGRHLWTVTPKGTAAVVARATKLLAGRFIAGDDGERESLFAEARPAVAVLEAVRTSREKHPEAVAALMEELAVPVKGLGDDPASWRALRAVLKASKGLTVDEVFAKVEATVAAGKAPAAWPEAAEAPADGKSGSLSGPRAAFVTVFDAAATPVQLAVLPLLDGRTRHDVFTQARLRPEWLDAAIERNDRAWLTSLAARPMLDPEGVQRLLELDDPKLNAQLFLRVRSTNLQRTAILSGRRFGAGEGPVPLDKDLRADLLKRDGGWRSTDAVDCADRKLQAHIISRVRVRGIMPQWRLLLDAWENHGREHVEQLVSGKAVGPTAYSAKPFGPSVVRTFTKLFKLDDPSAELAEMRAETDHAMTAEWQLAEIRKERTDHFALAKESHHWHWDAILASHREEPMNPWMVKGFDANAAGCPEELRKEADELGPTPDYGQTWESKGVGVPDALERLAASPLAEHYRETEWLSRSLRLGSVTPEDTLRLARPAALAVSITGEASIPALGETVAEALGDDLDAWVLALGMLRDFQGTVHELLATVVAAVGRG